jgi:hypothetical protein
MLFDAISPANASDLFAREIHSMLPDVYRTVSNDAEAIQIVKVHDACRKVATGEWLYPEDAVHSVIYLVRHPFDVAVSLAPHLGLTLPEAVDFMRDGGISAQSSVGLDLPLPQDLVSWTVNVQSWLDDSPHRVTLVRYEDMYADPLSQFTVIAKAAGFDPKTEDISRSLELASFENMKEEESKSGFRERPKTSSTFFREGKPNNWKSTLSEELRMRLVQDHGPAMERLGYMPDGSVIDMPHVSGS